jgi:hypothetical protein
VVELQLNPADLQSLRERMDLDVISSSLTEVYDEQVAAYQARPAAPGRAQVYVIASGSVPPGRYRLRQGDPVRAGTRPDRSTSRMRTPRPSSPTPPRGVPTAAPSAMSGRTRARRWQPTGPWPRAGPR